MFHHLPPSAQLRQFVNHLQRVHRTASVLTQSSRRFPTTIRIFGARSGPHRNLSTPFFATLGMVGMVTIGQNLVLRPPTTEPTTPTTLADVSGAAFSGLARPLSSTIEGAAASVSIDVTPIIAMIAPGATESVVPVVLPPPSLTQYVVQPGDTVNAIAAHHGISAQTVTWANRLANPNAIRPGQSLQIMSIDGTIHRVREGDSTASIATAFGVSVEELVAANQITDPTTVRPAEVLIVPNAMRPQMDSPAPNIVRPTAGGSEASFIAALVGPAQQSQRVTGVPASVTIAQAILETYWGTSFLAREANNYFGIKAHRKGGSDGIVWIDAWEVENGHNVVRPEPFRRYKSVTDSLVDHGRFFHENSRYAHALDAKHDAREFARRINSAGYATDPAYATKLIALMERHGLFQYNES